MLNRKGASLGAALVCVAVWVSACDAAKSANLNAPDSITGLSPEPAIASTSGSTPTAGPAPIVGSGSASVVAVGDTGWCGSAGMAQTARLVEGLPGDILFAGDLAYMRGTIDDYRRCFDPDWGRLRSRFRPAPGNHEFEDAGANGYFTYFGGAAGPGRQGYYAFRAATWHILMLNSAAPMTRGSAQYEWARSELQNNRTRCSMAVWHHPFATSGPNGLNGHVRDMWQLLHENEAEVVISGHDHLYERFAPQTPDYQYEATGIRQFVVGTGGAPVYHPVTRAPNTEAVVEAHGALKLMLHPSSYEWEFIEAATGRTIDRAGDGCH